MAPLLVVEGEPLAARRADSEIRGKLRGFGVGQYIELSGQMNERMGLRLEADGTALVFAGTHSHGQGHATTYAQVISDWLGLPFDKVRLVQGDTDRVAGGRGTFGARSMVCAGGALRAAADGIIAQGRRVAAQMLEANPRLTPQRLKRILIDSARRIPHVPVDRQGWGVVDPRRAVLAALRVRATDGWKD